MLLLSLFVPLSLSYFFVDSSTVPSSSWTFPGGLVFPYGDSSTTDGTRYKNDYRCEGDNMTIGCYDEEQSIEVVRGNFGRFSIAICNQHGVTDWSVNCMSSSTTKLLKNKCDGRKTCSISVNSESFPEDGCPGTFKYLEIHYACSSSAYHGHQKPPNPPWLSPWSLENEKYDGNNNNSSSNSNRLQSAFSESTSTPRKPILVTDKTLTERIPITTPRPSTSTTSLSSSFSSLTSSSLSSLTSLSPFRVSKTIIESSFDSLETHRQTLSKTNELELNTRDSENELRLNSPTKSPLNNVRDQDVESSLNAIDSLSNYSFENACSPKTARNLQWNWTSYGKFAFQPCPIGTTGLARWSCGKDGNWVGDQPDMSDCKAIAMSNLESQVRQEDPENVLISSLAYLTRTKSLYGGDLEAAVSIMRTVANLIQYRIQSSIFFNKESLIQEVLQNVLRSGSHILEASNRKAWADLPPDRQIKVATSLLLALEENAFLYSGIVEEPKMTVDSSELLTLAIHVLDESAENSGGAYFPPRRLLFVDDSIYLSKDNVFLGGEGGKHRFSEIVFFSFSNLHTILSQGPVVLRQSSESDIQAKSYVLNSRVVSASLGRGGKHVELKSPVIITLRHLRSNMTDPKCVFWNYESHSWSDDGCVLHSSNTTHSICHCDHLTHFALLSRQKLNPLLSSLQILAILSALCSVCFIFLIILAFRCRNKFRKWICKSCSCCVSFDNKTSETESDIEKCHRNFYTGLSPNSTKNSFSSSDNRILSQYVLASNQHVAGTLPLGNNIKGGPSELAAVSGDPVKLSSFESSKNPTQSISSGIPHITLNPYSSQLVDNLNLMMTTTSGSESTEVVYRAVSPHGHVYWEIDPGNYYSEANNNSSSGGELDESSGFRRSTIATESLPLISITPNHRTYIPSYIQPSLQRSDLMELSASFTCGRGRRDRRLTNPHHSQHHHHFSTLSQGKDHGNSHQRIVPEQLQRQIQIKDVKRIPVSVKSSEYIEAKIRTLRANRQSVT